MIKFDKDEFLNPQIYSTNDKYETRSRVSKEVIKDIKKLQQRIDKATEYLIKNEYATKMVMLNPDELLSILQDEEVK